MHLISLSNRSDKVVMLSTLQMKTPSFIKLNSLTSVRRLEDSNPGPSCSWCACVLSCPVESNSFVTPWTAAHQAPWDSPSKNAGVGCHFLSQGIFLSKPVSPALQADFSPPCHLGSLHVKFVFLNLGRSMQK